MECRNYITGSIKRITLIPVEEAVYSYSEDGKAITGIQGTQYVFEIGTDHTAEVTETERIGRIYFTTANIPAGAERIEARRWAAIIYVDDRKYVVGRHEGVRCQSISLGRREYGLTYTTEPYFFDIIEYRGL